MQHQFNVFGKAMTVKRQDGEWLLYNQSSSGMTSRIYDVVIPPDLTAGELTRYLDDI